MFLFALKVALVGHRDGAAGFESREKRGKHIHCAAGRERMNRGGDASGSGVLRIVAEVLRCCIRLIAQNIDITVWNE